jgi:hypothetical protein
MTGRARLGRLRERGVGRLRGPARQRRPARRHVQACRPALCQAGRRLRGSGHAGHQQSSAMRRLRGLTAGTRPPQHAVRQRSGTPCVLRARGVSAPERIAKQPCNECSPLRNQVWLRKRKALPGCRRGVVVAHFSTFVRVVAPKSAPLRHAAAAAHRGQSRCARPARAPPAAQSPAQRCNNPAHSRQCWLGCVPHVKQHKSLHSNGLPDACSVPLSSKRLLLAQRRVERVAVASERSHCNVPQRATLA